MTRKTRQGKRGDSLRIMDMQHVLGELEECRAVGERRFFDDRFVQDAAIRRFEVVGEAAGNVSDGTRRMYPDVPWNKMRGFASFAKHEYWAVNLREVWDALKTVAKIRATLAEVRTANLTDGDDPLRSE